MITADAPTHRFLDNLTTAILMFTDEAVLCDLNSAAEDLLLCSARKVLGQSVEHLLPVKPCFAEAVRHVLRTGESLTERNMDLVLDPERSQPVNCTVTALLNQAQACCVLVELTRIDWYQRMAREDRILNRQEMANEVLHGMAHEIKNPLGGIRGAAQLLELELENEELHEYTRIVISEVDRLGKLLDRMVGPKVLPNYCEQNVHEILEHVRQLVTAEAGSNIHIYQDYDPSLPHLEADRDQLVQIFLNILRNAVQAIAEQPGNITLRTRIERQLVIGNHRHRQILRVDLIDDGPGIPPDLIDKLFYPLVTGRPEGTGLGLSIAQSLVQSHGGLIECESGHGKTCFTVLLPLEKNP